MGQVKDACGSLQDALIVIGAAPTPALSAECLLLAARIHEKYSLPEDAKALWMQRCADMWRHVESEVSVAP